MTTLPTLTRQQLATVFTDPRTLLAFEKVISLANQSGDVALVNFVVTASDPSAPNAHVLGAAAPLSISAGSGSVTLSMADSTVAPGTYTNATVTVDAKGRVTNAITGSTFAPGGTSGQIQFNNVGAFGGFTLSGDGSLNTSTGALTVTKTGGAAFGALATQNAVTVAQLPTPPTFSVYLTAAQSVGSGAFSKVLFDTAEWNVGSGFDIATNHRFTPNQAGKYLFTGSVSVSSASVINDLIVSLYKNGSEYKRATQIYQAVGGGVHSVPVDVMASANGTTDYFEVFVFQDSGGSASLGTGAAFTWFQGALISP